MTLTIAAGQTDSNVLTSCPWIGGAADSPLCVAAAVQTELYRNYCKLFDQVKCDGVISKISLVTNIGGSSGIQALTIVSTYDRMGTNAEAIVGMSFEKLMNSSSVVIRNAVNNSVAKTMRSCWASDLQERTMFHDCTVSKDDSQADYYFDEDFHSDISKVAYFSPMLNLGVRLPAAAPPQARLSFFYWSRHTTLLSAIPSLELLEVQRLSLLPVLSALLMLLMMCLRLWLT